MARGPPSQYGSKHGTAKDMKAPISCYTCVRKTVGYLQVIGLSTSTEICGCKNTLPQVDVRCTRTPTIESLYGNDILKCDVLQHEDAHEVIT